MSEQNQNDTEMLEARLARVEAQLGHMKTGLWVFGVVLVCLGAMITPLVAVAGGIVAAMLAFLCGVTWVLERCFGETAEDELVEEVDV